MATRQADLAGQVAGGGGTPLIPVVDMRAALDLLVASAAAAEARYGPLLDWNTSGITTLSLAFEKTERPEAATFNGDLSNWNTGLVTSLAYTFAGTRLFNGNISCWEPRE